jgi:hypothetical protein
MGTANRITDIRNGNSLPADQLSKLKIFSDFFPLLETITLKRDAIPFTPVKHRL